MLKIEGLDHVVLRCADVEVSLRWWTEVIGLPAERVEAWRAGEVFFPSVRVDAGTILDLFPQAADGVNMDHLCLVVAPSTDLDALVAGGDFDVEAGPMELFGARGMGTSLYVRDPDGNRIELRTYAG